MKKDYILTAIFAFFLILFAVFSTKIIFHDAPEYITLAKNFAGIDNVDLFTTHSLLYPLIISPFLKIWPSFITIKLINCLWIFLIGLVLLFGLKNRKVFILFAFSPLIWYVSIQTTPVLPASFFFLLGYLFFKSEKRKNSYLYSGIFVGLACAFYDAFFLITLIFLLVYFLDKKFSTGIIYSIFIFIGLLPRLILDYWLFHMPFYSILKFLGTNAVISLGINSSNSMINFTFLGIFFVAFAISPLIFLSYRINFKDYKKEIIFIIISFILLLLRAPMPKYFLFLAPISLIFLSHILKDKEIKWHCILSIIMIIVMTRGYFGHNEDYMMQKDLRDIQKDYNVSIIIAGPYQANNLAVFFWKDDPRIAWLEDYIANEKNQSYLKDYNIKFKSRIPLREDILLSVKFNRPENKKYEDFILVAKRENNFNSFNLDKCYQFLCTYKLKN